MKPTHTSLFARATRYSESAKATPRENRLTECFAGVLERVEGLAVDLAVSWLDPDSSSRGVGEVSRRSTADLHSLLTNSPYALTGVRTQIRTSVGKFVDLELRFGSPEEAATDIVVWVEVKHGTGLHDEQALSYRASLRALHPGPHDMPVVILGRQSDLDPYGDQVPDDSPLRSWDRVGGRIRTLRDEPELFDDPVDRWLMQEFLTFLREEGLMPPERLGPEHLTALAYYGAAEAALADLTAHAASVLAEHFGAPADYARITQGRDKGEPQHGLNYWSMIWVEEEANPWA